MIPELNLGQLRTIIRDKYLIDAIGLNKVQGKPFSVAEVEAKIEEIVTGKKVDATSHGSAKAQGRHGGGGRRRRLIITDSLLTDNIEHYQFIDFTRHNQP